MTNSILPVARKWATTLLADLIARRACATSDLRLAGHWVFGAQQLASAIGDPDALALLNDVEVSLGNIANRYGDELQVLGWLGALIEKINDQNHESGWRHP